MAYELSSSAPYTPVTIAGAASSKNEGGIFNPSGNKFASYSERQGGAGSTDYGLDIFTSGASGWTRTDSVDTSSRVLDFKWFSDSEIYTVETTSPYKFFNYTSGASGWTQAEIFNYPLGQFAFNPSKTKVAFWDGINWTSPSDANDTQAFKVYASGSSGGNPSWSAEDTSGWSVDDTQAKVSDLEWITDTDFVIGMPKGGNSTADNGRLEHVSYDGSDWTIAASSEGHSSTDFRRIGYSLYYHTASTTLIVGAMESSGYASWNLIKSSSANGYIGPSSNMHLSSDTETLDNDAMYSARYSGVAGRTTPGMGQYGLVPDPNDGSRLIGRTIGKGSSAWNGAALFALESGSSGWKFKVLDDNLAGTSYSYGAQVDISADGSYIVYPNENLYNVDNSFHLIETGLTGGDTTAPTISSIEFESADTQNSLLNTGDVLAVRVTFDEAVTVATGGGTPYITLNIGGDSRNASYNSGTGNAAIIFTYTLVSGETADTDGVSIGANAIALNGGTLQDAAGNNATITHSAVSANSSFKVDTDRPTISSLSMASDNSTVTVTFAEDVYTSSNGTGNLTTADFTLGLSGGNSETINLSSSAASISKTSQSIWVLTLSGTGLDTGAAGTETLSVDAASNTAIYDLAGNAHTASASTVSLNDTATLEDVVTTTVGTGGGTVSAGGTNAAPGASVSIPNGALSGNTSIKVDLSTESANLELNGIINAIGDPGAEAYSPVVEITPHGTTLNSAATITFRLTGSVAGTSPADTEILKSNGDAPHVWYRLPSNLWSSADGVITISTTSFSRFQAIGGSNMARTKLKNSQIKKLTESNMVIGGALDITGSADTKGTLAATDKFLVQATSGIPQQISASVMQDFFSKVDVVETGTDASYQIVFVDDDTAGGGDGVLRVDGAALNYNPNSNLLIAGGNIRTARLEIDSASDYLDVASSDLTATAAANLVLDAVLDIKLSADGGNVQMDDGQGVTAFDFDVDNVELKIHDDAQVANYLSIAVGDAGATTIQTVDADAAAANLQITADGTAEMAGTTVTLDSSGDIVLSADGDNVTMDDGTTTLVDFNLASNAPTLKMMDGAQVANYLSIGVAANGATTIQTVDADAAAANLQITADGTVDIDSAGDLTLDSAADIVLDADGDQISLKFGGATGHIDIGNANSGDVTFQQKTDGKDFVFLDHGGQETFRIIDHGAGSTGIKIGGAYTFPKADGTENYVLQTDGEGTLSWASATVDIDGFTDGSGITVATTDLLLLSDGGTEKKITVNQLQAVTANPPSPNGDSLGTSALEWSDLYLAEGGVAYFGNGQEATLTHVSGATHALRLSGSSGATQLQFGDAGTYIHQSADAALAIVSDGTVTVDATTDIVLDADGDDISLKFGGATGQLDFSNTNSGDIVIEQKTADKALLFKGTDGSSAVTALQLDMANGGRATFAENVVITGDLTVQGTTTTVDSTTIMISQSFTFEGPADAHETTLHAGTPAADSTVYLPALPAGSYHIPALADASTAASAAVTAAEFALLDGGTARGTTDLASGDGFLHNDGGTMRMTSVDKIADFFAGGAGLSSSSGVMSVNIDGLTELAATPHATQDEFMVSDNGTEKRVSMTNVANGAFALVSGDATIDPGGALTIASDAVEPSMINVLDDSLAATDTHFLIADGTDYSSFALSGDVTCTNAGVVTIAANAVEGSMLNNNIVSGLSDIGAAIVATDEMIVSDAGTIKRTDVSRLGDFLGGGDGITVTSGVLSISYVEDIAMSASKNSILDATLQSCSLSQEPVSGSVSVYLNGMLQMVSGSTHSEWDYRYIGTTGSRKVVFAAAVDSDDLIQIRYIKK